MVNRIPFIWPDNPFHQFTCTGCRHTRQLKAWKSDFPQADFWEVGAGHIYEVSVLRPLKYQRRTTPPLQSISLEIQPSRCSLFPSSAKAYLRAGEYAKAENAYRKVLDIEKTKPAQDQIISGVLNFLAGLLLDQGRYKEADALYRQALQAVLNHPLIDPTTRDDICLNWASLRRDIGRTSEAVALEGWTRGTSNSPPPFPAELVVPPLVQLNGLTPNQFRRRLRQPYDNDLTALWNELGVAPWETCQWPQCVEQSWDVDLVAGNTGVLERVHVANGINGPTRFLLFEPTDHESNGVQEWKVYGIVDLPYGDRQGTARIEKSGDKRWLVLEAGSDAGSSRSYVETWYDLTGGKFQPVAGYPAGAPSLQSND